GQVAALVWSTDGSRLGAITHNGAIVWRGEDPIGRVYGDERAVVDPVGTVALSPSLTEAAVVGRGADHLGRLDVATGSVVRSIPIPRSMSVVGWFDEGHAIVAQNTREIIVFDAATGRKRGKASMLFAKPPYARPSPDARTLAIMRQPVNASPSID